MLKENKELRNSWKKKFLKEILTMVIKVHPIHKIDNDGPRLLIEYMSTIYPNYLETFNDTKERCM